jgi:polyphosphate kinase 2 (PPK2 family)
LLAAAVKRLSALQERLYAQGRWAVLAVLQGLDTAGKDGIIKYVLSGINPQGCEVHSFKQPSTLELAHDFLWRTTLALPARGIVGVFNRSYYEETVVVRVHPELLDKQNLPPKLVTGDIWKERYEDTIRHTATAHAPWYVIPADSKSFARLVAATVLVERMEALDLQYPKLDEAQLTELKTAEAALRAEAKAPKR